MWPKSSDRVLANVRQTLRHGRAKETADVEKVNVDDGRRNSKLSDLDGANFRQLGVSQRFNDDDGYDGNDEPVGVEHRVGDGGVVVRMSEAFIVAKKSALSRFSDQEKYQNLGTI